MRHPIRHTELLPGGRLGRASIRASRCLGKGLLGSWALSLGLVALLAACGGGGDTASPDGGGVVADGGGVVADGGGVVADGGGVVADGGGVVADGGGVVADGGSDGGTATGEIGTPGGTVAAASGLTLTVPYGALSGNTTLTVTTTDAAPPSGIGAISPVYQFQPDGLIFSRPVTVALPLPAGTTSATVYWSRLGADGFDAIGGRISGNSILVETTHFSQAVIGATITTRTVSGVARTTWLSATARSDLPNDLSAQLPEALITTADGGYSSRPAVAGTGAAAGTFTIANVPVGSYILHYGTEYLVTSSNAPDLGSVRGGRPESQRTPAGDAILNLSLTNLSPWTANSWMELYSTEADDWDFYTERFGTIAEGATTATLPITMSQINGSAPFLIQGSLGDHTIVAQLAERTSSTGVPYLAMARVAQLPTFDVPSTGSLDVGPIAMTNVSLANSINVDYRGTQFAAAIARDGNPAHAGATGNYGGFAILAQAGGAGDGFYNSNADPLSYNDVGEGGTDLQSGAMGYGAPSDATLAGNWGLLFNVRWSKEWGPAPFPGTTNNGRANRIFSEGLEWTTTPAVAQSAPVVPLLTMPRAPLVNGISFFAGGSAIGTTPSLSWTAPLVGQPLFYVVGVFELYVNANNRTDSRMLARITTPETSVRVPPGILQTGGKFVLHVSAIARTSASSTLSADAPYRGSLHVTSATTTSGLYTP